MAVDTKKSLRNQVLYSIYVRNYSKEGTFAAVQADLDRIKALGTDIIWLLPIHPTGEKNRKGSLGSPYAIRDYRAVNPEFGTLDDFRHLVDAIHARGMKCIIDVVYNHTSPDSWLAENHPEWFYHKPDGSLGNRFGDWWDVADLDYSHLRALGLPDRNAQDLGPPRRRLPLRCRAARPAGVLEARPRRGRDRPSRLLLAVRIGRARLPCRRPRAGLCEPVRRRALSGVRRRL